VGGSGENTIDNYLIYVCALCGALQQHEEPFSLLFQNGRISSSGVCVYAEMDRERERERVS
jgi:hypothetical protein